MERREFIKQAAAGAAVAGLGVPLSQAFGAGQNGYGRGIGHPAPHGRDREWNRATETRPCGCRSIDSRHRRISPWVARRVRAGCDPHHPVSVGRRHQLP